MSDTIAMHNNGKVIDLISSLALSIKAIADRIIDTQKELKTAQETGIDISAEQIARLLAMVSAAEDDLQNDINTNK